VSRQSGATESSLGDGDIRAFAGNLGAGLTRAAATALSLGCNIV